MGQAMKDLDAMRSMAARYDKAKTQQSIRAGEYSRPVEHPRTLEVGRGHVRGTRYRGRAKSK